AAPLVPEEVLLSSGLPSFMSRESVLSGNAALKKLTPGFTKAESKALGNARKLVHPEPGVPPVPVPRGNLPAGAARPSPGNLYIGAATDQFLNDARQVPALAGHYDVVIHGTQGNLFAYIDNAGKVVTLTPQQLAQRVLQRADYNGEAIRLIACNAAAPGSTAAQDLASSMGKLVVAPDKLVFPHAPNPSMPYMAAVTPQGALTKIAP